MAYSVGELPFYGVTVSRVPNVGNLAIAFVSVTGGGTTIDTGPGTTDPVINAVGQLWPSGDGTPSAA